ncbi:MAG: hypothetical protein ACJA1N_000450 [Saprospiraceae bacterium]|jgi:hypothetical protein
MKQIFIIIFCLFAYHISAQDTTIHQPHFTLEIIQNKEDLKSFHYEKMDVNSKVVDFHLRYGIGTIIKKWLKFMELEEVDYRIENQLYANRRIYFKDSTSIYNYNFDVILTNKSIDNINSIEIQKEAFEIFAEFIGIKLSTVLESQTYWELRIINEQRSAIPFDQNKFWKRTEDEDYIYYENIQFRRIADLLSRKLDVYVRLIPYDSYKYNIRMPYSDDLFDLKYAMIEHGLELVSVTKEIEVLIVTF